MGRMFRKWGVYPKQSGYGALLQNILLYGLDLWGGEKRKAGAHPLKPLYSQRWRRFPPGGGCRIFWNVRRVASWA